MGQRGHWVPNLGRHTPGLSSPSNEASRRLSVVRPKGLESAMFSLYYLATRRNWPCGLSACPFCRRGQESKSLGREAERAHAAES